MNDDRILGPREMEDIRSKTSQRHTRGWLFVCGDARMLIPWMALGFWSSLVVLKGRSRDKREPIVHSMLRLQCTTVLSLLALLAMAAGWAFGVQAGGGTPSIGLYQPPAALAQTARHLEWLCWRV